MECPYCFERMFYDDGNGSYDACMTASWVCPQGCRKCVVIDCDEQALPGEEDCLKHAIDTTLDDMQETTVGTEEHGVLFARIVDLRKLEKETV